MHRRRISVFALLFFLWILLSGRFEPKFLIEGFLTCLIVSILTTPMLFMQYKNKTYFVISVNPFKFLFYLLWLFKEIIKSSWDVSITVLNYNRANPEIVTFFCPFKNPVAIAVLTNSIILTPGTVTIDVSDNNEFTVHALTSTAAEGLLQGDMLRRVGRLYGEDV